jgi:2-polyprenyl-3-methyl-5-hydroxy-6-metoxy-1,4-benzoquinol methylase
VSDFDGRAYQARFDALADEGMDVHGEASLVRSLGPRSVLDAGCGTGRVAIELARHGIEVVGVDIDASMLGQAKLRAPELQWVQSDLATLDLATLFDVVLLAGNVPLFCAIAARPALVAACAGHVAPGGAMVAGFELERGFEVGDYDPMCQAAGLTLIDRWSTWDGRPFADDSRYAVSVHRR